MKTFSLGNKYEYCPNGNCWQEISGIFDKKIHLFCDCNECCGKVYELRAVDVTKKANPEAIERARNFNKLDNVRMKIDITNMDSIEKYLKQK